jgi:hypothetical protein
MSESNTPLVTVGDRYVLVERIDSNEVREVWRGHDDLASRQVVIKLYDGPETNDEGWRTTFDRTARRLAALSDPGIASVLDHDAEEPPVWLVLANVPGTTLDVAAEESGLPAATALRVIGQVALALKTAHDAGVSHGAVSARHVMLRPDGAATLIGFDLVAAARPSGDLAALRSLAAELLTTAAAAGPGGSETARFLSWLEGAKQPAPTDLGDIGRTALAVAMTAGTAEGEVTATVGPASGSVPAEEVAPQSRRPWYDEAERKRVRNGLIALGTIVVVAGAVLLWVVDRNGGPTHVNVPSVVGLTLSDAQNELTQDVLRVTENVTDPKGIVTAQSPPAGTEVKVGTLVILTIRPAVGSG